jgi:hypothetical protein
MNVALNESFNLTAFVEDVGRRLKSHVNLIDVFLTHSTDGVKHRGDKKPLANVLKVTFPIMP